MHRQSRPGHRGHLDGNGRAGAVRSRDADLNEKAYEAIRLLSTPPANGPSLNADELRSLLSDRLDKIQTLATKVIAATKAPKDFEAPSDDTLT